MKEAHEAENIQRKVGLPSKREGRKWLQGVQPFILYVWYLLPSYGQVST